MPFSTDPTILMNEIEVHTYRASGPGGQKRNKTESAVRIRHVPSGTIVVATESRSQRRNREVALARLVARLEARNRKPKKRIPTRRSRAVKARIVEEKRRHSRKKALRGRVSGEND